MDTRLTAQRFDLVILDLRLPLISGRAVRDKLLAHTRLRHIPLVVVTGDSDLVFTSRIGTPFDDRNVRRISRRAHRGKIAEDADG